MSYSPHSVACDMQKRNCISCIDAICCVPMSQITSLLRELESYAIAYKAPIDTSRQTARMQAIAAMLNDPQNAYPSIHVAGTSGKGSTAQYASAILHAHGLRVGLTISPHLIDVRERAQVNGEMLSEKLFCQYLQDILVVAKKCDVERYDKPTYFELTMLLAFYIFREEKVDCAVIETGLGGTYDASNIITRKNTVRVITPIGYDHMEFLGNTLTSIAKEKAGIIHENDIVISAVQESESKEVIMKVCNLTHSSLEFVKPEDVRFNNIKIISFVWYDKSFDAIWYILQSQAIYQAMNAAVALSAASKMLYQLMKLPFKAYVARNALFGVRVAGRFDHVSIQGRDLLLDGAHNPQKMSAFLSSLTARYPARTFHFVLAFSATKDFDQMLHMIIPLADHITITTFGKGNQGMVLTSADPRNVLKTLHKKGFRSCEIVPNADEAILHAILLQQDHSTPIIVTGSLYLVSDIYTNMSPSKIDIVKKLNETT